MNDALLPIVEAIIFASENPVKIEDIVKLLQIEDLFSVTANEKEVSYALATLMERYKEPHFGFHLVNIADGYQFVTKADYSPYVKEALLIRNRKKLSQAGMECLAIIAYRQPVTKTDVEYIRGVNSDYAVQKLLEKNLVQILGKSELPGRPLLYGTTPFFLEYLGIKNMQQLPKLTDLEDLNSFSLPNIDIGTEE